MFLRQWRFHNQGSILLQITKMSGKVPRTTCRSRFALYFLFPSATAAHSSVTEQHLRAQWRLSVLTFANWGQNNDLGSTIHWCQQGKKNVSYWSTREHSNTDFSFQLTYVGVVLIFSNIEAERATTNSSFAWGDLRCGKQVAEVSWLWESCQLQPFQIYSLLTNTLKNILIHFHSYEIWHFALMRIMHGTKFFI